MKTTNNQKMSKADFVLAMMNAQAERKAQATFKKERLGRNPIDKQTEKLFGDAYDEMKRERENW